VGKLPLNPSIGLVNFENPACHTVTMEELKNGTQFSSAIFDNGV
jgi:hypothetical protein